MQLVEKLAGLFRYGRVRRFLSPRQAILRYEHKRSMLLVIVPLPLGNGKLQRFHGFWPQGNASLDGGLGTRVIDPSTLQVYGAERQSSAVCIAEAAIDAEQ